MIGVKNLTQVVMKAVTHRVVTVGLSQLKANVEQPKISPYHLEMHPAVLSRERPLPRAKRPLLMESCLAIRGVLEIRCG